MSINVDSIKNLAQFHLKEYGKINSRMIATNQNCCYLDVEDVLESEGYVLNKATGYWEKPLDFS